MLTHILSLALCGVLERLAAVEFIALSGRAPLGGVLSALAVLAWRLDRCLARGLMNERRT